MRTANILILLFLLVVFGAPSSADTPPAGQQTAPATVPSKSNEAPVFLDHKELFRMRTGVYGYSVEIRATEISRRIEMLARDYTYSPEAITIAEGPLGTEIIAGDRLILNVLEGDAKPVGKTHRELANEYAGIVRKAVIQYRIDYSRTQIVRGSALAVLATLILVLLIRLNLRIHTKILKKIQTRIAERYGRILEDTRAKQALDSIVAILNFIRLLIFAVLFVIYLQVLLGLLPWTRPLAGKIIGYVLIPLSTLWQGFVSQIPNLFFVAVLAAVVYYSLKIIRLFFNLIEVGRLSIRGFEPEWSKPTYNIVRILVIAFALVVAFPYLPGSESPAFKGVSIFIGILFSLGSSSAIANIIAGLSLTYRRAFRIGDLVRIGDAIGTVTSMRLSVTHIRTAKNEIITIPNSQIVNTDVINYSTLSAQNGLILHTSVTIGYDIPWRQVHALLLMAAEKTEGILKDPAPFVLQRELHDFYVKYELNAFSDDPTRMLRTYSLLHQNIQDAFNEYGVQIMSPNYEADPEAPKIVPRDKWFEAPAKPE